MDSKLYKTALSIDSVHYQFSFIFSNSVANHYGHLKPHIGRPMPRTADLAKQRSEKIADNVHN